MVNKKAVVSFVVSRRVDVVLESFGKAKDAVKGIPWQKETSRSISSSSKEVADILRTVANVNSRSIKDSDTPLPNF